MEPLVSIIIPAYNAEPWIADTVRSAVAQTWPKKEIIIVDDGSTDDTLSIARSFESKEVKVVEQPNAGACRARNRGLNECQGDFIQWLDADDLLARDKIAAQLEQSDDRSGDSKVLLSGAWGRFYFRPKKAKFISTCLWKTLEPLEWLILRLKNPAMIQTAAWLVSRNLTQRAGPWDERLERNQDGEYFSRVVSQSSLVEFVADARCYYRVGNPRSITNNFSPRSLKSVFLSLNLCVDQLLTLENSERTRKACVDRYEQFLSMFLSDGLEETRGLLEDTQNRILALGGKPAPIRISKKYALAQQIVGRRNAAHLRAWITALRSRTAIEWDRLLALAAGTRTEG